MKKLKHVATLLAILLTMTACNQAPASTTISSLQTAASGPESMVQATPAADALLIPEGGWDLSTLPEEAWLIKPQYISDFYFENGVAIAQVSDVEWHIINEKNKIKKK